MAETVVGRWHHILLSAPLPRLFDPTPSSLIPPAVVRAPKIAHQSVTGPKAKSQCAKSSSKKRRRKEAHIIHDPSLADKIVSLESDGEGG